MRNLLILMGLLFSIASCTPQKKLKTALSTSHKWYLQKVNEENLNGENFRTPPYIRFDHNVKKLFGQLGCNSFSAPYQINKDSITIDLILSTKMSCPNLEFERNFSKLLSRQSYKIKITDTELTFTNHYNKITFKKRNNQ